MDAIRFLLSEFRYGRAFRPWVFVGVILLAVDVFMILAEMAQRQYRHYGRFELFSHPGWIADPDGSFAEMWMYFKATVAAILLLVLGFRWSRAAVLFALALLFVTIAIDDMFRIHENVGGWAVTLGWGPKLGLRGQDWGELAAWSVLGVILMIIVILCYRLSGSAARSLARLQLVTFVSLMVFAIGFDMVFILSRFLGASKRFSYLLSLVETTGELASFTLALLVPLAFLLHTVMYRANRSNPKH